MIFSGLGKQFSNDQRDLDRQGLVRSLPSFGHRVIPHRGCAHHETAFGRFLGVYHPAHAMKRGTIRNMSFLSWFRGRTADYPNDNPGQAAPESSWIPEGQVRSLPGVTIDADVAVSISAMFRAVHLVATTIASFPISISEKQPDGSRMPREYAVDSCIWRKPNHEQTRVEFWSIAVGHVVLNGNCFLFVAKEEAGYSLWAIEPERVAVARDENTGAKYYRIDSNKVYTDFRSGGNIIHVTGWGRDGLVGVSPVTRMANALGLAKATEEYASRYFGSGTTLSGVLSTDQALTPEQASAFKGRWDASHRGLSTAHEVAVLSNGLKWQSAATSPDDSQMTDVRSFQVAEIGRIVGVPEHLIGSHDKQSSWGQGLEINNRAFVQFGLMHHILRFEQAINDDFLAAPEVTPQRSLYTRQMKFNLGGMMRGTNAERAAFYRQMQSMGVYTVNKILALEDEPGIGAEGDIRLVPGNNLVPLESMLAPVAEEASDGEQLAAISDTADVAAQALNGAQIASLLEVLQLVTVRQVATSVALAILEVAFPTIPKLQREQMVRDAAAFEPAVAVAAS